MAVLVTSNPLALRVLMTDDLYKIDEPNTVEQHVAAASVTGNEEPVDKSMPPAFNYLGDNNKYVLILVNDAEHEFCSPANLEMLLNILKAKQLELKDIALVNLAKQPTADIVALINFFGCSKITSFGINPAQLGLTGISSNQISMHEGVRVLATSSFGEMNGNPAKKRAFWDEMKKL